MFEMLYTTTEVEEILSDEGFVKVSIAVLHALLKIQEDLGLVPLGESERLCGLMTADVEKAAVLGTTLSGNPVGGLVQEMYAATPYALLGITGNDLWDTSHVMQLKAAVRCIIKDLKISIERMAELTQRYAETPMIVRTHGQAGPPATFGLKLCIWLDELMRGCVRLQRSVEAAALVSACGPAVNGSSFVVMGVDPEEIERRLGVALDLGVSSAPWTTARDRLVDVSGALGQVCTLIGRIGHEIYNLQRTGINEIEEVGSFGSLATPQKTSNPWTSQRLHGLGVVARSLATMVASSAALPEGEREIGTFYAEWYGLSHLCRVSARAAADLQDQLVRLRVNTISMRFNLDREKTAVAESVSMYLAKWVGKEQAHRIMKETVAECRTGVPFAQSVRRSCERVGVSVPEQMLSPPGELGRAVRLAHDISQRARNWLLAEHSLTGDAIK